MNRYPNNCQTVTDQCIFCSKTPVPGAPGEDSAKTPPRWLTNSGCIAEALSAWCGGAHKHQHLVGTEKSVAEDSMLHAPSMYLTIMKEMSQQLQSYLCVNAATETTHVECVAEDDVKGGLYTPTRSKLPGRRRLSICGTETCTSVQLGSKHGRKRDATQLASNDSIPTRVPLCSHAIVHVWYARKCATTESNKFSRQHHRWSLCEF